jgi:molecular chaperone DnaK
LRKTLTYNVVEAANGDAWIRVDDRDLSPEALLALLLAQLKRDAELAVGHEVTRAAVSVPAHFNDTERRAMANACKLAGLSGAMLVNDTTAAMLAHAAERRGNVRTAVIDLDTHAGARARRRRRFPSRW